MKKARINGKQRLCIFLEPLDSETNAKISEGLKNLGVFVDGDNFGVENKKPVFECPYRLVSALVVERKKKRARFKVWIRSGGGLKNGEFLFKK